MEKTPVKCASIARRKTRKEVSTEKLRWGREAPKKIQNPIKEWGVGTEAGVEIKEVRKNHQSNLKTHF